MRWIIKTEHGYMLEDLYGNLVQWFDMAANCKAFCMEKGVDPVYLSKSSNKTYWQAYKRLTGKTLWWQDED
jgi:hypothetical protein